MNSFEIINGVNFILDDLKAQGLTNNTMNTLHLGAEIIHLLSGTVGYTKKSLPAIIKALKERYELPDDAVHAKLFKALDYWADKLDGYKAFTLRKHSKEGASTSTYFDGNSINIYHDQGAFAIYDPYDRDDPYPVRREDILDIIAYFGKNAVANKNDKLAAEMRLDYQACREWLRKGACYIHELI